MPQDNITKSAEFLHKSVKLDKNKIEVFLKNYSLGSLLKYKWLKRGFANTVVYLKTIKGEYILKIAERNNPERVRYEIDLLDFIKRLPAPHLIETKEKKKLINYDQIHKAFIYNYLPGKQVERFSPSMLRAVGHFLGKFHNQTVHFRSSVTRIEWYNYSRQSFKKVMLICKRVKQKNIKKQVEYIGNNLLPYAPPKSLPYGAMHIDFKPENTLFVKGKLTGVVDFDNSYQGPLVLDLANTLMWFCSKEGNFDCKKALIIFKEYKKAYKMKKQEKAYLFDALHYAFLSHILMDIYLLVHRRLPLQYVLWGLRNILRTQKNLPFTKESFQKLFY